MGAGLGAWALGLGALGVGDRLGFSYWADWGSALEASLGEVVGVFGSQEVSHAMMAKMSRKDHRRAVWMICTGRCSSVLFLY